MCSVVLYRFYHCFSYRNEIFSAHLVVRFIIGCHFVALYACLEPHMPHTITDSLPCHCSSPAGTPIAMSRSHYACGSVKKIDQSWSTNVPQFLGYVDMTLCLVV